MNNHEYLEQKFGRVRSGRDLEEHYVYLVSQINFMEKYCVDVFNNPVSKITRIMAYTDFPDVTKTEDGCCLLNALDNLQVKLENNNEQ